MHEYIGGTYGHAPGSPGVYRRILLSTVAEQLASKYEQGMSKYPWEQYRDRIGPTIEIVYHKVVQTP